MSALIERLSRALFYQNTKRLFSRIARAEIPLRSAALAYHTLLSAVPVVGLVLWYLQSIGVASQWKRTIKNFIFSHVTVSSSAVVVEKLDALTRSVEKSTWGAVAVLLFVYAAFSLVDKLGVSLDVILETRHDSANNNKRGFLKILARRFMVLTGLPFAIIVSVAVTTWLKEDSWLRYIFKLQNVGPILVRPIPWLVDIFVIFLLYVFIPRNPVSAREAFRAAIVAGPLFELGKWTMGYYSARALTVQKVYGPLSVVPIFIIWVQVAWMIFLGAALLIRTENTARPTPTPAPRRS